MDNGASSYRRYLEGDRDAFDEIMKDYFDRVIFFINRFVNDMNVAEDIAIDVFADLIIHPKRYNFSVSLNTYLCMLGRSYALNYLKRKRLIRVTELEEATEIFASSLPDEQVIKDERSKALHDAILRLPSDMRAAVHLVYFEEMSYKDCAYIMKKTVKQIDNLLYRAKKELGKTLSDGWGDNI
jgi:RNA polymerase sigma-70 factor (ECF subfamily)